MVELSGLAVEEAVGERATDALVKEDEHQGNTDAVVGQPIGITVAVALQ